ncbi:MAG: M10 family metallopeptidase C-terminal domain-containing protein [Rhodospirillales bacterium]|nr:M10 family metallopeptidase C-terminal domain-containing protein [Rhodospirillales bacterium]
MAVSGNEIRASGNNAVDGLLCGYDWQPGSDRALTYSFHAGTSASEKATVRAAFSAWEGVINIDFREVSDGADSVYKLYYESDTRELGSAYLPQGSLLDGLWGLNSNSIALNNLSAGAIGYETAIHEIGHVLGLKHPHDSSESFPSFADVGMQSYDTSLYTVMSYNDYGWSVAKGHAVTPMALDIQAAQYMYGVNTVTGAGNDTYTISNDELMRAVWDAGGIDIFDARAQIHADSFDLNAGGVCKTGTSSIVEIAYGVTIEGVLCGAGSDTVAANAADNLEAGNGGNDLLYGNAGLDTICGNAGADTIRGGTGNDQVYGGSDNDHLYGDLGDDAVRGDRGNDLVRGGQGNDTLYGGRENDQLMGDYGNDRLSGDIGNDTLTGGFDADTFMTRYGTGADIVTDFNAGEGDRIEMPTGTAYTLADSSGGAMIQLIDGTTLTLQGFTVAQISTSWLQFA